MEENENLYAPIAILAILVIASALIVVFHRAEREYAAEAETAMSEESRSVIEELTEELSTEKAAAKAPMDAEEKDPESEPAQNLTTTSQNVTTTEEPATERITAAPAEEIRYNPVPGDYIGTFELTAYEWTGSPMANGEMPYYGACASNYFALGTVLYIDGYGTFTVKDRGGPSMGNNIIDIYLGDEDACWEFGVRTAEVYYG